MSEHDGKARPLPGEGLHHTDGYRGDNTVAWTLVPSKVRGRRSTEMFGTWCPGCLTSWGWVVTAEKAARLHRAMKRLGCPRCEKAASEVARAVSSGTLEERRAKLRK
jgi:hypothetical protein